MHMLNLNAVDLPQPLAHLLARHSTPVPALIAAGPDPAAIIAACHAFAAGRPPGTESLIVILLHEAAPGLANLATHTAWASLQAFTRHAALDWAARRIRLAAVTLAGSVPPEDVARTITFIAANPSITGQVIALKSGSPSGNAAAG